MSLPIIKHKNQIKIIAIGKHRQKACTSMIVIIEKIISMKHKNKKTLVQ